MQFQLPVQQAASVEKRAGPSDLGSNVDQISSHGMMISIGKVDLQVQLTGCTRVSQQGTGTVETGSRQGGDVRVNQTSQLRTLHHQKGRLIGRRHF